MTVSRLGVRLPHSPVKQRVSAHHPQERLVATLLSPWQLLLTMKDRQDDDYGVKEKKHHQLLWLSKHSVIVG